MYFLIDVDMHSVLLNNLNNFVEQLRKDLRTHNIRYSAITVNKKTDKIEIGFRHASVLSQAKAYISDHYQALNVTEAKGTGKAHPLQLSLGLKLREANKIRHYAVSQTVDVLRNRVNALGVAEASVSQQGLNRVVVQLPGVQDAAHAKEILGGTATIKVMMVNQSADIANAVAGHVPIGSSLYHEVGGRPTVLKNRVIVTGDAFVGASVGYDSQTSMPVVNVKLSGPQVDYFSRVTADNIGKLMAIVLVQTNFKKEKINGKIVSVPHTSQKVINEATINERLGNNFIITGIGNARAAQNLSMMIRAGALPAPIQIAESKQIGPTLGRHNIEMGEISVTIAMVAIMIFMALYYRLFGLIADFALFLNLILIVAVMSIMPGATLTLPGIAGIVLNVGMAIDANVLIFERIREEIRNGTSMQAAIHAGYARAFGTIVDSNVTTLIVALILFAVGTGAIKGFAVTLMIGIVSSMFTAITVTRGLVNVIYGKRQVKQLSIGIKAK
jgi:preprotein translocase subunit SecD